MLPRSEQKQQTRLALMAAARNLMDSGRGFSSLSLREVTRCVGLGPAAGLGAEAHRSPSLGSGLVA